MQERLKSHYRTRQFLWIKRQSGAGTMPFQGLALEGVGVLRFPPEIAPQTKLAQLAQSVEVHDPRWVPDVNEGK